MISGGGSASMCVRNQCLDLLHLPSLQNSRFLLPKFSSLILQKLEDNVLKGDEELTVQSEDGKGAEKVAARVRDIVTKSLTDNTAEVSLICIPVQYSNMIYVEQTIPFC